MSTNFHSSVCKIGTHQFRGHPLQEAVFSFSNKVKNYIALARSTHVSMFRFRELDLT